MPHVQSTQKAKETQFGFPLLSDFWSPRMLAQCHGANRDGMIFALNIADCMFTWAVRIECLHWMFELNFVYILWSTCMFTLSVWIECLNCMKCSSWMFTLNIGIECLNRIKDVQKKSVTNVFEYPRWKFR